MKPFYNTGLISKDDYKDIMRRAVPKVLFLLLFFHLKFYYLWNSLSNREGRVFILTKCIFDHLCITYFFFWTSEIAREFNKVFFIHVQFALYIYMYIHTHSRFGLIVSHHLCTICSPHPHPKKKTTPILRSKFNDKLSQITRIYYVYV